jgi:hypothetical protein
VLGKSTYVPGRTSGLFRSQSTDADTIYLIEGDVKVAPQARGQYVIKGELRDDYSAVWVEDLATGKQQGNKLLVKGSTALNRRTLLLFGEGAAKSSKQKVEEIPPQ